jgi:3-phosphoshikimate 1-carboxyvinyltransferase
MSSLTIAVKTGPVEATVRPPGSKSLTIRALFAAALARGESRLIGPLDSGDTVAARRALRALGVSIEEGPGEWIIGGTGGILTPSPEPIDVGESGLTARSLTAVAALVPGPTEIVGQGRLPVRPMGGLLEALSSLGVGVRSSDGGLPLVVDGTGVLAGGSVRVAAGKTTQFGTALLMVAPFATGPMTIETEGLEGSAGYLDLTIDVMEAFGAEVRRVEQQFRVEPTGYQGAPFAIEPDASAAVYPMVAAAIRGGKVTIDGLDGSSRQPDFQIAQVLSEMGCQVTIGHGSVTVESSGGRLDPIEMDLSAMPDGALAVAVACLFAKGESRLDGLSSLRLKESDRLRGLAEQLQNVGGEAWIEDDGLVIVPGPLHPATIETYGDHRIAMAFALIGQLQEGIVIEAPEVADKTWPGFWEMLDRL